MKIMLCGASDLRRISKQFETTVEGFSLTPQHFINADISYRNDSNWAKNSENTVVDSDIIILAIVDKYGETTWETEYKIAIESQKPIIIFCHEDILNAYYSKKKYKLQLDHNSNNKKLFDLIEQLQTEQRTLVPFEDNNFSIRLKEHLAKLFHEAIKLFSANSTNCNSILDVRNCIAHNNNLFDNLWDTKIVELKEDFARLVEKVANESNYKVRNLYSSGIYDVYPNLETLKVYDLIKEIQGGEIIIMRMYLSESEFKIVRDYMKHFIINNNCSVRIILLSPSQKTAIETRLRRTSKYSIRTAEIYVKEIERQLLYLYHLKLELEEEGFENRLNVRVHEDFISTAIIGYKDEILYSHYLHGRFSEQGAQTRVRGKDRLVYKEYSTHYELQWQNAFEYQVIDNEIVIKSKQAG